MPTTPARSPFNRPHWTEEDAREVLAALQRSGQPVSAFAQERGLDPQRVYSWRRRFAGAAEPAQFQKVVVRLPSPGGEDGPATPCFEIALGSGCVVRVPASFDAAALRRLLDVLAASGTC